MSKKAIIQSDNSYLKKRDASLAMLLEHQNNITNHENEAISIDSVIAEKRAELVAAKAKVPDIGHLLIQREDIHASIAIGHKTNDDLLRFDKQSEAEKKIHRDANNEFEKTSVAVEQSLTGLKRKLSAVRNALNELHTKDQDLILAFIRCEAELACDEYVKTALIVTEHYLKLSALDGIAKRLGGSNFSQIYPEFSLPTFRLPQCDGVSHPVNKNFITSEFLLSISQAHVQAKESILDNYRDAGITGIG